VLSKNRFYESKKVTSRDLNFVVGVDTERAKKSVDELIAKMKDISVAINSATTTTKTNTQTITSAFVDLSSVVESVQVVSYLDNDIQQAKEKNIPLKESLDEILDTYDNYAKKKSSILDNTIEQEQQATNLSNVVMNAWVKNTSDLLTGGFGEEGFKTMADSMFKGFKMILNQTLDYVEKMLILGEAGSLVEAILNPTALIKNAPLLIAAEIAIMGARSAIASWVPKFAEGGGVIGPTYLLAGEANKKEYIISADQVQREIHDFFRTEKQYYSQEQTQQTIRVELEPVEFVQHGSDLVAVVKKVEKQNDITEY
jgi:hypothetical protein